MNISFIPKKIITIIFRFPFKYSIESFEHSRYLKHFYIYYLFFIEAIDSSNKTV